MINNSENITKMINTVNDIKSYGLNSPWQKENYSAHITLAIAELNGLAERSALPGPYLSIIQDLNRERARYA
ncbi:MAG: hypothetical protein LBH81_00350 [Rickettsiales bacterium]|jgi:hypothetical protein|nr:hypothetical protein [Rickettsiales bacterium]